MTCDFTREAGRALLDELLASADFVIESGRPGRLDRWGLDYTSVSQRFPALIYVSMSGFGQDGPKAQYAESDLILMAAGGPLFLQGEPGLPPVRLALPQAWHHAASDAAGAALIAL